MTDKIKDKIMEALDRLVERKRIIFWYDEKGDMREFVEFLMLPGVEVIHFDNNPFSVKYRILKGERPERGFIVYLAIPRPADEENWLLDLEEDGALFSADISTVYATECEIPVEYKDRVITSHIEFFKDSENRQKLSKRIQAGMIPVEIERQMIGVTAKTEPDYDQILLVLAHEALKGKDTVFERLKRYNLLPIVWDEINYRLGTKDCGSVKDLLITLFREDMEHTLVEPKLKNEAYIFMRDWRDSIKYGGNYKEWAKNLEQELGIINKLEDFELEDLLKIQTFPSVDPIIAFKVARDVENSAISSKQIEEIIDRRENTLFFENTRHTLEALLEARRLFEIIEQKMKSLSLNSIQEAFRLYQDELYEIDLHYRHYFREANQSEWKKTLMNITKEVERKYSNDWLNELARKWQPLVDALDKWEIKDVVRQNVFYSEYVHPFMEKNKKLFVIISDALRFETMIELEKRIGEINRMETSMKPAMLSMLPSYTQLGMASLLPHKELSYDKNQDEVFADGMSTKGTAARQNILSKKVAKSWAVKANEFLDVTSPKQKFKDYDLIYIYSNRIDAVGDKVDTEKDVFKATEEEICQIINIITQIRNGNGTNILITSDHGYLYQNETLDESEFSEFKPEGDIINSTRRFVIGNNLKEGDAVKTWRSEDVGLKAGRNIQTAKAMNRMRKQGSGTRFVHGGSMLQEIMVPVLHVNIKKPTDIGQVDVEVLNTRAKITTNRQTISFYQSDAVTDKMKPSVIRAGFYDSAGNLLSDSPVMTFGSRDEEGVQREQKHIFIFKEQLSGLNGREVTLKLERKIKDSEQFAPYSEYPFKVSVMFADEF